MGAASLRSDEQPDNRFVYLLILFLIGGMVFK